MNLLMSRKAIGFTFRRKMDNVTIITLSNGVDLNINYASFDKAVDLKNAFFEAMESADLVDVLNSTDFIKKNDKNEIDLSKIDIISKQIFKTTDIGLNNIGMNCKRIIIQKITIKPIFGVLAFLNLMIVLGYFHNFYKVCFFFIVKYPIFGNT